MFATKLTELQESSPAAEAEVPYILLSEVQDDPRAHQLMRRGQQVHLPEAADPDDKGGLERRFIEWADKDTKVEAFCKVHEYRHDFLRRPYLKADGMPAQYSPDFLVRTDDDVYVVETKAQSALSDENVSASSARPSRGSSRSTRWSPTSGWTAGGTTSC